MTHLSWQLRQPSMATASPADQWTVDHGKATDVAACRKPTSSLPKFHPCDFTSGHRRGQSNNNPNKV